MAGLIKLLLEFIELPVVLAVCYLLAARQGQHCARRNRLAGLRIWNRKRFERNCTLGALWLSLDSGPRPLQRVDLSLREGRGRYERSQEEAARETEEYRFCDVTHSFSSLYGLFDQRRGGSIAPTIMGILARPVARSPAPSAPAMTSSTSSRAAGVSIPNLTT